MLSMSRILSMLASLAALALFGACASVHPELEYGEIRSVELKEAHVGGYRLAAGDDIEVIFAYHPERSIKLTVRPDGMISMPFAEEVAAAGKTVAELDHDLTERVELHLRDAELSVVVRGYAKQKIYVGGEVKGPRELTLTPGLTVYQAVAAAGWFTNSAARESVVLVRHVAPGERQAMKIDCSEDAMVVADVELQPFDIVYVPNTPVNRVAVWVDEHINKVLPRSINLGFVGFGITGRVIE